MIERYILYISLGVFVIQVAIRAFVIVCSGLYDVSRSHRKRVMVLRARKRKPLISVLLVSHNSYETLLTCLDHIYASSYRRYEIVIVDSASRDGSKRAIKDWMRSHPNTRLRLLQKRTTSTVGDAYVAGLRQAKGDIVLLLGVTDVVQRDALEALAATFCADRFLKVVQLNRQALPYPSLLALLTQYGCLLGGQLRKCAAVLPGYWVGDAAQATFAYRRKTLNDAVQATRLVPNAVALIDYVATARRARIGYADRAVVSGIPPYGVREVYEGLYGLQAVPIRTDNKIMRVVYSVAGAVLMVVRLAEPILLVYATYLAYTFKTATLFWLVFGVFTGWLLLLNWSEPHGGSMAKLRLVLLTPVLCVLYGVRSLYVAILSAGYIVRRTTRVLH